MNHIRLEAYRMGMGETNRETDENHKYVKESAQNMKNVKNVQNIQNHNHKSPADTVKITNVVKVKSLTKADKNRIKKERKEAQKIHQRELVSRRKRAKRIRNYLLLGAAVVLIGIFLYWNSLPAKNVPIISISDKPYNFGTVSQAKGTVEGIIPLTNKGDSPLLLTGMETSCACTSASIVADGIESPKFNMAMHGTNPTNWKLEIAPGKTVSLKIYYNPNVHKTLRGPVTRSVIIHSNDPKNPSKEVRINANQVD